MPVAKPVSGTSVKRNENGGYVGKDGRVLTAISGISGRFPESDSVAEFKENLFNGVDMVTTDDRRWPPGLFGLPEPNGKIKTLDKFDAGFFNVNPKQSHVMDPMVRMLLELTHEAIIDAGVNPVDMRGSRTGNVHFKISKDYMNTINNSKRNFKS